MFNARRLLLAIALTGALAAVTLSAAGIAWSAGVLDDGPAQIRVYGGGQVATPAPSPRTISLTASANPQGREAYGSFRHSGGGPGVRGDVTCLTVAGNNALVGGFIREGSPDVVGLDFVYAVTDNGRPGSGADTAGFIDVGPELDNPPYPGLPANFPMTCPDINLDAFGVFPLTGDVSIELP